MKRWTVVVIILLMGTIWAAVDLGTKHWVKYHLATSRHLLAVDAVDGDTVCDAFRKKIGIEDCKELKNRVYAVQGPLKSGPNTSLTSLMVDYPLLFVFNDTADYALRLQTHRTGSNKLFSTVGEALKATINIRDQDLSGLLKKGLFGLPRGNGAVDPDKKTEKGKRYLLSYRVITLIPGMLDFSYVENPAGAWGFLHGLKPELRKWVFYVLTLVALVVIIFLMVYPPSHSWWVLFALGGILGGAIGNLTDRFSNGAVVDFIHMFWGRFDWPNYNVADIGITVGLVILLIHSFFDGKKPRKS